jgi:hypothetical protein
MPTKTTIAGRDIQVGDRCWYKGNDQLVEGKVEILGEGGVLAISYTIPLPPEQSPGMTQVAWIRHADQGFIEYNATANDPNDLTFDQWIPWAAVTSETADLGGANLGSPVNATSTETTILSLAVSPSVDVGAILLAKAGWSVTAAGTVSFRLRIDGTTVDSSTKSLTNGGSGDVSLWARVPSVAAGAHAITLTAQASAGTLTASAGHLAAFALGQT